MGRLSGGTGCVIGNDSTSNLVCLGPDGPRANALITRPRAILSSRAESLRSDALASRRNLRAVYRALMNGETSRASAARRMRCAS